MGPSFRTIRLIAMHGVVVLARRHGYAATREAAMTGQSPQAGGGSRPMAKATTKLNAQDRVTLFCAATGIDHAAVGIVAVIVHNRETGAYALTDSGRATLTAILEDAGLR